jgi:hypothetical protein
MTNYIVHENIRQHTRMFTLQKKTDNPMKKKLDPLVERSVQHQCHLLVLVLS